MFRARPLAWGALLLIAATLAGCGYFAVMFTPEKQASTAQSPRAKEADEYFWRTLHAGKYDDLTPLITALTAAYLENPHDATIAAHLGFAHIWRLPERNRLARIPPEITDDAVLASKYFGEAVRLNREDGAHIGILRRVDDGGGPHTRRRETGDAGLFHGQRSGAAVARVQ
jgi:hypothetical protein